MQLLGVLLFWFPRSILPDKPVGTGAMRAEFNEYNEYKYDSRPATAYLLLM